ncbi:ATP-binding protein [Nitrospira sp. Nam80]
MVRAPIPTVTLRGPYRSNIDYLHDELARIELFVRAQVIRWQHSAACAAPENDWGMVVVSHAEVECYLKSPIEAPSVLSAAVWEEVKPWWDAAARLREEIDELSLDADSIRDLRLLQLSQLFELSTAERDILLLCLLAELDDRYRRLFGYLQNDASRQSLQVELITQMLPVSVLGGGVGRDLFSPTGRLLANRLIVMSTDASGQESLPLRSVRIDDRIASYLLGSAGVDPRLTDIVRRGHAGAVPRLHARPETLAFFQRLPAALRMSLEEKNEGVRLLLLGPDSRLAAKAARATCRALDIPLLEFDVRGGLRGSAPWELLVDLAYRDARLCGASLFFYGCETILAAEQDRVRWEYLAQVACRFTGLTIAEADSSAFPRGVVSDAQFWQVDLPPPDYDTRKEIWLAKLPDPVDLSLTEEERVRLAADLANAFQTTEAQIEDAVAGAWHVARRDKPIAAHIGAGHLFEACRRQAGKRLVAFAQRIEPTRTLTVDDVVLPEPNKRQLLDLRNRIRYHRELLHGTGLDQTMRLAKGLLALFAGSSGTGKTMAAEALANGHGVDLYKVDLSAVVSKWVGETEKNLSRIFAEAEASNGWLFFDEGESLFGTRGDIKQAQDRLLNLEVNYLLQRIEEFSGVVILATNLRQNIDNAFIRRIHAYVEFPQPNAQLRAGIWKKLMPASIRRDVDDQQLGKLAALFDLSGGHIRNAILDALFRSCATEDRMLTLRHLVAGIAREYQKLGRPITSAEFGDTFYQWVVEDILDPQPARLAARK